MGGTASRALSFGFAWIVLGSAFAACKSKPDVPPPDIPVSPVPSASTPAASPPPAVSAPAIPSAAATLAPSAAKPVSHAAEASEIRTCCAALRKEATGTSKGLFETAAKSCDGISELVLKGTTRRDAAMTSIRAAVRGANLPASCR